MMIGVMEFLFSFFLMLGGYAWGRSSDQTAKRKVFLVLALFLGAGGVIGIGLAPGFGVLMVSRVLMGFALACIMAVGGAMVADRTPSDSLGSSLGRFVTVGGVGYTLGLLVAGLLVWDRVGVPLQPVVVVAGVFACSSGVAALVWVREASPSLEGRDVRCLFGNVWVPLLWPFRALAASWMVFGRRRVSRVEHRAWAYLGSTCLHFLATGSVMVLLPLYLVGLGAGDLFVFGVFIIHAAVAAVLFAPFGRAADRVGFKPTQIGALGLRALAFVALAVPVFASPGMVALVLVVVGATFAALQGTGQAALMREMAFRERGELNGLYRIASALGLAVGGLVAGGMVHWFGFGALFVVAGLATVGAGVVKLRVVYPSSEGKELGVAS